MICYKDMTFCSSPCANTKCHRRLTEKVVADAEKWWGSDEAPIALADFRCEDFVLDLEERVCLYNLK